jgi:hypothetical protein
MMRRIHTRDFYQILVTNAHVSGGSGGWQTS